MRQKFLPLLLGMIFLSTSLAPPAHAGPGGTTITGTKTASATITTTETFHWTIEKSTPPNQVPFVIPQGGNAQIQFTITATRTGPVVTTQTSAITGDVCVTNTGSVMTNGLHITDQLEVFVGGSWVAISSLITLPVTAELQPGETQCFPFSLSGIELDPQQQYRNHAIATIDNFLGHEGTSFGIDILAPVVITQETVQVDPNAVITDTFICPTGFTCTPPTGFTQTITGSISISFTITPTNDTAECGQTIIFFNNVSLDPSTTHVVINASASVEIFTGSCPPPTLGCTRTQGFWGSSPQGQALVPILVPGTMNLGSVAYTAPQLDSILDAPSAGNALIILAHQLIAAKLNILAGASSTPVAQTIVDADNAIGSLVVPPVGTDDVPPNTALGQTMTNLANTLDQYNNGNLGVPHCE